jgi:hypothetical protein
MEKDQTKKQTENEDAEQPFEFNFCPTFAYFLSTLCPTYYPTPVKVNETVDICLRCASLILVFISNQLTSESTIFSSSLSSVIQGMISTRNMSNPPALYYPVTRYNKPIQHGVEVSANFLSTIQLPAALSWPSSHSPDDVINQFSAHSRDSNFLAACVCHSCLRHQINQILPEQTEVL